MKRFTEYNVGGTHEQNPHGGIPIGKNSKGQTNLVEQGETRYDDYIYSNDVKPFDKDVLISNGLDPKLINKSYADISKKAMTYSKERPNDPIAQRYEQDIMNKIKNSQEQTKAMNQENERLNALIQSLLSKGYSEDEVIKIIQNPELLQQAMAEGQEATTFNDGGDLRPVDMAAYNRYLYNKGNSMISKEYDNHIRDSYYALRGMGIGRQESYDDYAYRVGRGISDADRAAILNRVYGISTPSVAAPVSTATVPTPTVVPAAQYYPSSIGEYEASLAGQEYTPYSFVGNPQTPILRTPLITADMIFKGAGYPVVGTGEYATAATQGTTSTGQPTQARAGSRQKARAKAKVQPVQKTQAQQVKPQEQGQAAPADASPTKVAAADSTQVVVPVDSISPIDSTRFTPMQLDSIRAADSLRLDSLVPRYSQKYLDSAYQAGVDSTANDWNRYAEELKEEKDQTLKDSLKSRQKQHERILEQARAEAMEREANAKSDGNFWGAVGTASTLGALYGGLKLIKRYRKK